MLGLTARDFKYSAREQWENFGARGDFATWIVRQINKFDLLEEKDFSPKMMPGTGGRPRIDYMLTEAALRKIQLGYGEKKYALQSALADRSLQIETLLKNPRYLAQIFLDYAQAKDKLDLLHHSPCMLSMQEIAKDLGFESARALNQRLIDLGYMYRDKRGRALPYAHKIPSNCYAIKASACGHRAFNHLQWTLEGKHWIAAVLGSLPKQEKESFLPGEKE